MYYNDMQFSNKSLKVTKKFYLFYVYFYLSFYSVTYVNYFTH